eukprot:SAG22_NODE_17780_length_298_cov_1.266332_1_plen_84_part_01
MYLAELSIFRGTCNANIVRKERHSFTLRVASYRERTAAEVLQRKGTHLPSFFPQQVAVGLSVGRSVGRSGTYLPVRFDEALCGK